MPHLEIQVELETIELGNFGPKKIEVIRSCSFKNIGQTNFWYIQMRKNSALWLALKKFGPKRTFGPKRPKWFESKIDYKQAGVELGQVQIKLELGFTQDSIIVLN